MKLCKDCKHFHTPSIYKSKEYENIIGNKTLVYVSKCKSLKNRLYNISVILGNATVITKHSCTTLRDAGWLKSRLFNLCGKEGRWYETM